MKPTKSVFKIVLWTLLGFTFLKVAHVLIEVLKNQHLLYGFSDRFSLIYFKYYLPVFSFITTLLFGLILIVFLNKKLKKWNFENSKFPTIWFVFTIRCSFYFRTFSP